MKWSDTVVVLVACISLVIPCNAFVSSKFSHITKQSLHTFSSIQFSDLSAIKSSTLRSSRLLLSAVSKKDEVDSDGEKKPKVVKAKKVKVEGLEGEEPKKVKKVVKAKAIKTESDEESAAGAKKVKTVKALDISGDGSEKSVKISKKAKDVVEKVASTKKSSVGDEGDDMFDGDDIFDLKELLGEDFLSETGEGMGLLPNLDEDLAKLEANLSELGDFGFDFDDDDDDEALRSIESGKFDIERFLKEGEDFGGEDGVLEGLPNKNLKGTGEGGNISAVGRGKKERAGSEPNKKKIATSSTLQQTMRGVEEDDDEIDGLEDDSVSDRVLEELALSLGLGGDGDDLMDVDFDNEDNDLEDDKPMKAPGEVSDATGGNMSMDGVDIFGGLDDLIDKEKETILPLIIDGLEVDREGFELGVEPPPLEEFKRLMESLGPDSMFADDYADSLNADEYLLTEPVLIKPLRNVSDKTKAWLPLVFEGGKSERVKSKPELGKSLDWFLVDHEGAVPADWRVQVISVVTNSTNGNTTALDMVNMVYNHIQASLTPEESERINFQILQFEQENGEAMEEHEDMVQMWLESYNTYHLVDGAAMKEAWGSIMPHIMLAEKNLDAIRDQMQPPEPQPPTISTLPSLCNPYLLNTHVLDPTKSKVRWALAEDSMEGACLTPRLRRLRFRGGAQEMTTGYNTQDLESEFSVVSVR